MIAGRLDYRLALKTLAGNPLAVTTVATLWAGITVPKEGANIPEAGGLRSPMPIEIWLRYRAVTAGQYLVGASRMFHINSVRTPGRSKDLVCTCTELAGNPATYTPSGGSAVSTLAVLLRGTETVGQYGEKQEARITAQLPVFDVPSPLPGASLVVGGGTFSVGLVISNDGEVIEVAVR